jgi:small subunit ribosomal protein S1
MRDVSLDQASRAFLATVRVGDIRTGTVTGMARSDVALVVLDGFAGRPLGTVGPLDLPWGEHTTPVVGRRITAQVTGVDRDEGMVRLSMAAAQHPELWTFLNGLHRGDILSGTVAAIERFGVFVALDDGPDHPVFPGVGFITVPELSWRHIDALSDVVAVGQRVSCEFLQFDTWNGEARLSLRATQPDPFQAFADATPAGSTLHGRVTKLTPIGVFVQVADAVVGLVPGERPARPPLAVAADTVRVGDEVTVVVTEVDRQRRRLALAREPDARQPDAPRQPVTSAQDR